MDTNNFFSLIGLIFNFVLLIVALKYFIWNSKKKNKEEEEAIKENVKNETKRESENEEKLRRNIEEFKIIVSNSIQQQYEHCNLIKGFELKECKQVETNSEKQIKEQYEQIKAIQKKSR